MIFGLDVKFMIIPFILFCAIYMLTRLYMTEKRHFTDNDKLYFTLGGAVACLLVGLYINETLFLFFALSFLMCYLTLIAPAIKSYYNWCMDGWQKLYCILMRNRKK